ncbi:hypothetical protein WA026_017514 [Henosepilachna vigintioctopunctata]|uniref:Prostaglandin reductase 1 n=1 Tax=Henosepilachna vigintioctopunctata TaxID=420089 RepID=A0AAW1UVS0_9CUCU
MVQGKKFILQNQFEGLPKASDVKLIEEELPALKNGEFLCETVYLSVDPYQRAHRMNIGDTILGHQVAKIIESKSSRFPPGRHIVGYYGWKTHHIYEESVVAAMALPPWLIPEDYNDIPLHYFLGVLGIPGISAYFGLLKIAQPKYGETVVVTGAAGAVGSVVGQMAKIKGCRTIGVVGTDLKGEWITNDLGFDGYINYKKDNFAGALKELAPKGVDCYYDNVGGEISSQIIKQMNVYGRISVCGAISGYNDVEDSKATSIQYYMVFRQLKMEGFLVPRFAKRFLEAIKDIAKWVREGRIKSRETVTKGFENTFQAFVDMLEGKNTGKAIIEL